MLLGGAMPRAKVRGVIDINAIHDVLETELVTELLEAVEKLVLAVEATVRVVLHVVRVLELVRIDVLMAQAETLNEIFRVTLV